LELFFEGGREMTHAERLGLEADINILFGLLRRIVGNDTIVEFAQCRLETMQDRIEACEGPLPIVDVMRPILARAVRSERPD
jgi:hypothetical protein